MFNKKSYKKNAYMLNGSFKKKGYDWWWHSFTAYNHETKEAKAFYIEFFIINPGLYPDKIILGQDEKNIKNGLRPSYLMINVGTWGKVHKQLHRFFPINNVSINKCPIEIKADDCYLSETEINGSVEVKKPTPAMMSDEGSMSWNLKIKKDIAWNVGYGTSSIFRFLKAFEMYWHSNGMKTFYEGEIIFDGIKYDVVPDISYGYSDKNWGSDFTSPWVWLSSCHMIRKETKEELHNSVFDIGGGRPKAFGIKFHRKLLAAYYIEGKEIEMNFSKFLHPCKTVFSSTKDEYKVYWDVVQENREYRIITHISCKQSDMLLINYEAPDGSKRHNCLWNGGNGVGEMKIFRKGKKDSATLIEDLELYNVGCEYGEFCPNSNDI